MLFGLNNVINCDETGLFFKLAPSKSLVSRIRKGIKKYKDRLTVLLTCNMSGTEKLTPFIVGKFRSPRAFKNFNKDFFCKYNHNKNAWMTSILFNQWLYDLNIEFRNQNRKILLILDNCRSHKITVETSNIELLFLPVNSTAKLQPLDGGIIRSFKAKFYNYQLSSIVNRIKDGVRVGDLFKEFSIKDGVIYSKYAWDDVTHETIRNCWKKTLFRDSLSNNEEEVPIEEKHLKGYDIVTSHLGEQDILTETEFLDFKTSFMEVCDDSLPINCNEGLQTINSAVEIEEKAEFCFSDNEQENEDISLNSAFSYLEHLKAYFLSKKNVDQKTYDALKILENNIACDKNKEEFKSILDFCRKK